MQRAPRTLARLSSVLFSALILASPAIASTDGGAAIYSAHLIASARAAGMGGVTSVLSEAGIADWRNPGFLALERSSRVAGFLAPVHPQIFAGDDWLQSISVAAPVGERRPVVFGAGFATLHHDPRFSDDEADARRRDGRDTALRMTVACRLAKRIGFGLSVESVRSELSGFPGEIATHASDNALSVSLGLGFADELLVRRDDATIVSVTPLFGLSVLHWGEDVRYPDESVARELPRQWLTAVGLRIERRDAQPTDDTFALHRFALTMAAEMTVRGEDDDSAPTDVGIADRRALLGGSADPVREHDSSEVFARYGVELALSGLLSARYGYVDDNEGRVEGNTFGIGAGDESLRPVGFRVDWAAVPSRDNDDFEHRWGIVLSLTHSESSSD